MVFLHLTRDMLKKCGFPEDGFMTMVAAANDTGHCGQF